MGEEGRVKMGVKSVEGAISSTEWANGSVVFSIGINEKTLCIFVQNFLMCQGNVEVTKRQ